MNNARLYQLSILLLASTSAPCLAPPTLLPKDHYEPAEKPNADLPAISETLKKNLILTSLLCAPLSAFFHWRHKCHFDDYAIFKRHILNKEGIPHPSSHLYREAATTSLERLKLFRHGRNLATLGVIIPLAILYAPRAQRPQQSTGHIPSPPVE